MAGMELLEIKYHLFYSVYPERGRYIAWLLLCVALAVHIADEAATGFLGLWNPEMAALGWRGLQMNFSVWIALLGLGVIGLLILSYWVRRGTWWTVHAGYAFSILMLSNGLAHLGFSMYERAWMPGSYTSPLLVAGSLYLWMAMRAR